MQLMMHFVTNNPILAGAVVQGEMELYLNVQFCLDTCKQTRYIHVF